MKISVKNFRSIKRQCLELAPITVVYGPNGAGKSSLLYALLTMRNIVLNSAQQPAEFFNYGFLSLGNYEAVVYDHQKRDEIELGISIEHGDYSLEYTITLADTKGRLDLKVAGLDPSKVELSRVDFGIPVTFPYSLNASSSKMISVEGHQYNVTWNGVTAGQVSAVTQHPKAQDEANLVSAMMNAPAEALRRVAVAPPVRGFWKPEYSTVGLTPLLISQEEMATYLANNRYLEGKISNYLEQVLERDFRVHVKPGTGIFTLDVTDRPAGLPIEIVNDGVGVNQLVYLLAKTLHNDTEWVCLEEPEIHLHPSAVRRLSQAFVKIMKHEQKRFLISTQSEALIIGLLREVGSGHISPGDIAFYFARRKGRTTEFERQAVNEKGQIEGGLLSFAQAELEDLKQFLVEGKQSTLSLE